MIGHAVPEQAKNKSGVEQSDQLIEHWEPFWQFLILSYFLCSAVGLKTVAYHVGDRFLGNEVGTDPVEPNQFQGQYVSEYLLVSVPVLRIEIRQKELRGEKGNEIWDETPIHYIVVCDES